METDPDDFSHLWIKGIIDGLQIVPSEFADRVLSSCAKRCAESFPLQFFTIAASKADSLQSFLGGLESCMQGVRSEIFSSLRFRLIYPHCGCDLVVEKITSSPLLCRCSLLSLQYQLETVLNVDVSVTEEETILRGHDSCKFIVALHDDPWKRRA